MMLWGLLAKEEKMLGLKWFPLEAVCGIKTPLWFAVLKPTTVTEKNRFQF